jgi:hypothetical protein
MCWLIFETGFAKEEGSWGPNASWHIPRCRWPSIRSILSDSIPAVVPKQARARGPNRIPLGLLKFTNMTSHDATPLAMLPSTGKMLPQTGTSCEGGLGMTAVLC